MDNNDDELDYSGIPDFAPKSQWAKGPPDIVKTMLELKELAVPTISREKIISQLYIEAMDRRSRNQAARIRAWELIAELKGYKDKDEDIPEVTDNLTHDEISTIAKEFNDIY